MPSKCKTNKSLLEQGLNTIPRPYAAETLSLWYTASNVYKEELDFIRSLLKEWLGVAIVREYTPDRQKALDKPKEGNIHVTGMVIEDQSKLLNPTGIVREIKREKEDSNRINMSVIDNRTWKGAREVKEKAAGYCSFSDYFEE